MKREVKVFLGAASRPIGLLRYDQQGTRESSSFEYDPAWLEAPDAFPIEPSLPLVRGAQFHRKVKEGSVFHAAIADTEPDGWGRRVIDRDFAKRRTLARQAGAPVIPYHLNSVDYLLAVDDESRCGALRFQDERGIFMREAEPGRRTTPPLIELRQLFSSSRAIEANQETATDLAYLRGRGSSLGGLRPKCSVIDEDGLLAIGKFASISDERPVTKGEVLALRLAARAGINAAHARIIAHEDTTVSLIRRFDRTAHDSRLMYISAATMLQAEPTDPSAHYYTEIVDALRQHGASPTADIEELWRRIAFSVLITNVDDHLQNHGFLHAERGQWRLSPAFDINPFPERVRELKTWISQDAGPEASIDNLMSVIGYFRIKRTRALEILAEVSAAVARWRKEGQILGLTARELDMFAEAFEHTERQAARNVSGGQSD